MHAGVVTTSADAPLITIAQRMVGERIHAVVVRRSGDGTTSRRRWKAVSDQDLLRCVGTILEMTAIEAASEELLEVGPDDRLADVAASMGEHGTAHAVVVDPETDEPIGVISTLDVARIVAWGPD